QARRSREMTGSMLEQSQARKLALENELRQVEENLTVSSTKLTEVTALYQEKAAELSTTQARISELDRRLTDERREMLTVSQSETHLDVRNQTLSEKVREQDERLGQLREV